MKYQEILNAVNDGAKFAVNFPKKTLKLNGKEIEVDLEDAVLLSTEAFLELLEDWYERYEYSVPSERSESRRHNYFRALPEEDMSDTDLMFGESREYARCKLELFVLTQLLLGFRWDEEKMGKWFWQCPYNKDLILLREWF